MAGRRIAVQGLGHVGYWLTKHLSEAGAKLVVADIDAGRVERAQREFQAEVVGVDQIVGTECDVFAPCALGAVINDESVSQIQAGVICGAANNQLLRLEHADQLRSRGILYAPDYVVNAGGVINISEEWADGGYDEERATSRVKAVRESLAEVFDYAEQNSVTTAVAADRVAERILQDGGDHSLEQCGR